MNMVILDAFAGDNPVSNGLLELLKENGENFTYFKLQDLEILPCRSCGSCELTTPGQCVFHDRMPEVMRALAPGRVLVMLTPVRFGGYSSQLKKAVDMVTPLYIDTLPYPVIWFLEQLSSVSVQELRGKNFFAVAQCGFPDISLLHPLLESCRFFAETMKMKWLGGLGYGGGALIDGAWLENLGRKGRRITAAFQIAVEDIVQDKNISPRAQELLTIKIPKMLYRPLAVFLNYQTRKDARSRGLRIKDITRKAYLENNN